MSNYVTIRDTEDLHPGCHYGNWLTDIPFLLFQSCKTNKYLTATSLLFGPKLIKANHELGLNSAHSTKEIWITEWLEGQHRVCRLRSSKEANSYWALTSDKDNNLFLSLEPFDRDSSNSPFKLLPDGRTIHPSPFYIALLDGKIAFQYVKSNQWVYVTDDFSLSLLDHFNADCQFFFGTKVSFFRSSILSPSVRLHLAASKFRHRLHFKSILALSSESFVLLFQQDHIKIQSTHGRYWNLDKESGHVENTSSSLSSSLRIRLQKSENNTWNLLAGLPPSPSSSSSLHNNNNNNDDHNHHQDQNHHEEQQNYLYEFLAETKENRLCLLSKLTCPHGGHYSIQLLPEVGLYLIHQLKETEEKGMVFRCSLEETLDREIAFAKARLSSPHLPSPHPSPLLPSLPVHNNNNNINNNNNNVNTNNAGNQQGGIPTVPSIVRDCVEYLKENISKQGLFRECGVKSKVDRIKVMIDKGFSLKDAIAIEEQTSGVSENEIASLLKLYFSDLPEPLLTFDLYSSFLEVPSIGGEGGDLLEVVHPITGESLDNYSLSTRIRLQSLIKRKLPKVHYDTLHYLIEFLREVTFHSPVNKMNAANLAIVFGPNLLKPKVKSEDCFSNINPSAMNVILYLIIDFSHIF